MITIQVNERTKAGKALLETARIMADTSNGVTILTDEEDDPRFLKRIIEGMDSGPVSREKVIAEIDRIRASK